MKTTLLTTLLALAATSALAAPAATPNTECFIKRADGLLQRDGQSCGYKEKREPKGECFVKRDAHWVRDADGQSCGYKREAEAEADANVECFVKRADGLFQRDPQSCGYKE